MWLNIKKLLKLLVFNAKFSCVVCAVGGGVRKQNTAQVGAKCWRRESRKMLAVCGCGSYEMEHSAIATAMESGVEELQRAPGTGSRAPGCHSRAVPRRVLEWTQPTTHTYTPTQLHNGRHSGWRVLKHNGAQMSECNIIIFYYFFFFFVIPELKMLAFVTYRWQLILIEPDLWHKMLINMFSVFINNCLFEIL